MIYIAAECIYGSNYPGEICRMCVQWMVVLTNKFGVRCVGRAIRSAEPQRRLPSAVENDEFSSCLLHLSVKHAIGKT